MPPLSLLATYDELMRCTNVLLNGSCEEGSLIIIIIYIRVYERYYYIFVIHCISLLSSFCNSSVEFPEIILNKIFYYFLIFSHFLIIIDVFIDINVLLQCLLCAEFLKFALSLEEMRQKWLASVQECQRLHSALDKAHKEIADFDRKLRHARRNLEEENCKRRAIEEQRNFLVILFLYF